MRRTACRAKWMTIASRSCALCTIAAILASVRCDLAQRLAKWQGKYAKLCAWVEDNIEETLTYYRLPLARHKHMKSTNMLERLNQEIKRRTHVVRIFPEPKAVRGWRGRSPSRPTGTGWRPSATSTWSIYAGTRKRLCGPWPPDGGRARPAPRTRGLRGGRPSAIACRDCSARITSRHGFC